MTDFLAKLMADFCVAFIERIATRAFKDDVVHAIMERRNCLGACSAAISALRALPAAIENRFAVMPEAIATRIGTLHECTSALVFVALFSVAYSLLPKINALIIAVTPSALPLHLSSIIPVVGSVIFGICALRFTRWVTTRFVEELDAGSSLGTASALFFAACLAINLWHSVSAIASGIPMGHQEAMDFFAPLLLALPTLVVFIRVEEAIKCRLGLALPNPRRPWMAVTRPIHVPVWSGSSKTTTVFVTTTVKDARRFEAMPHAEIFPVPPRD